MKRRERYKRVLGILIAILCMEISALISIAGSKAWNQALENMNRISYPHLSYEEWIAIHEPDFQSYDDAQSAYYKYAEGFYTPEYREAQKVHSIQSGDNYILPHGRNECNNRPKWASSYWRLTVLLLRKHFAQEELQTNLKVC